MIHVIEELHLNDFKEVHCVRPRDLFTRYGKRLPNVEFDSSEEVVPMNMSKLESIEYLQQYDRMMQDSTRQGGMDNESPGSHDSSNDNASD